MKARLPDWIAMLCGALVLVMSTAAFAQDTTDADLKQQLETLEAALNPPCQGCDPFWQKINAGDAKATVLLDQIWSLLEGRVADALAAGEAPGDIADSVGKLGSFDSEALVLDPQTILFTLTYENSIAEAFLIKSANESNSVVWRLGDFPSLYAEKLPDTANGAHRFYMLEGYFQMAGCDEKSTLGIWRVDKAAVKQLLAKPYPTYCGEARPRFDKQILHIPVKRQFQSMAVGASEPGREMDWQIAIRPYAIKDLGEKSTAPTLDAIDELFHRMFRGRSTAGWASKRAVAVLKPIALRLVKDETAKIAAERAANGGKLQPKELADFPFLGELLTRPDPAEGKNLCLEVSGWGHDMAFSFDVRKIKNRAFIDDAAVSACPARNQ